MVPKTIQLKAFFCCFFPESAIDAKKLNQDRAKTVAIYFKTDTFLTNFS